MNPRIGRQRNYCILVFTDGRGECLRRTVDSFRENMGFDSFDQKVMIDDSADPAYRELLLERYPDFKVVSAPVRRGFAGAIQAGWSEVLPWVDYVFHLEDDFVLEKPVDVDQLAEFMEERHNVIQVALLRQAWNEEEKAAGGIIEANPEGFERFNDGESDWIEHRKFFTTNPSLYPRWLTRLGWPSGEHSEGRFGIDLFARDPNRRSVFWGEGDPWVTHIGDERVGTGY